ncbi:MAG: NAD(P)/FAD-dependent oxidoreductase, partial [Acidiferrobacterales bacterium]
MKARSVVVVGGGIVGVASALYLQRDGHAVTLIDRNDPGEGCSLGNAGILGTYSVIPLATADTLREIPRMLVDPLGPLCIRWRYLPRLLPWLARFLACARPAKVAASTLALAAMQNCVLDAYRVLLDQASAHDLVSASGLLYAYESENEYAAAAKNRDVQRQHGVAVKELSGAAAHELLPALGPDIKRATLFPNCAHTVNPLRLVQTLAEDFVRRGGNIKRASVTGVDVQENRIIVHTATDRYLGEVVVVALGAWSRKLASALGSPVPLDTERGY